ncbi:MAG TPA: DUF4215 domain-containing protein, partial [Kofleriaceae bacterium]
NAVDTVLGEVCDLGTLNSNLANASCRTNCQPQRCGDTVIDNTKGEVCDDGNVTSGDNCSADCKSNETCGNGIIDVVKNEQCDNGGLNSNSPNATCRTTCTRQSCGDMIVDTAFGEGCDLGAANSNLANATCRLNCTPQRCGDGIIDNTKGEVCDDSNTTSGDGCSSDCKSLETCGNGIIDIAKGEECDDNNTVNGDGCQGNCKAPRCGDGIKDANEQCDAGPSNANTPNAPCRTSCALPRCGDNIVDNLMGEVCDDNNNTSGDGCSANCASNETCGNGIIDPQKGEQCDDGNTRTRDGCSKCLPETAITLVPGQTPPARVNPMLVYDAGRQRVVLFGGWTPGPNLGDTWEWDGVSWTRIRTKHSPAPRLAAASAYDAKRHRVVLFGGFQLNYGAPLNDTWEYDGVDWTERTPAASPSARAAAAMAFDGNRGMLVLFGGATSGMCTTCSTNDTGDPVNDTWTWNGTVWTQLTPPATGGYVIPEARSGATMAFDATNKYVLMFGGLCLGNGTSCNNPDGATYTWDGTGWKQTAAGNLSSGFYAGAMAFDANIGKTVMWKGAAGTTYEWSGSGWTTVSLGTPTARGNMVLTYDAARKQVLQFGGSTVTGTHPDTVLDDTWVRGPGSVAWTQPAAFSEPSARMRAGAAYDPVRRKVVLFGGNCGTGCELADTWEWDGRRWSSVAASTPPPVRAGHVLDYDTLARTTRLYGGDTSSTAYTDVYNYNGSGWSLQSSAGRTSAKGATMSFDASANRLVTFGGVLTSTSTVTNQTWTWSPTTGWAQASPTTPPPARDETATAYDPVRQRTVVFSGNPHTGSTLSDVWEWNGANWNQVTASGGPSQRTGHRLYYNTDAARVCVFGSASGATTEDLYEWNGATWLQRSITSPPSTRYQAATAYDSAAHELLVFSGRDATTFTNLASTLRIQYQPNGSAESCVSAQLDYDNDGKLGCADEDCWGVCDPLHPPGASRPAGAPFCGDNSCNGPEDCNICPADCGACAGGKCGDFHCDSNVGETAASCPTDC